MEFKQLTNEIQVKFDLFIRKCTQSIISPPLAEVYSSNGLCDIKK